MPMQFPGVPTTCRRQRLIVYVDIATITSYITSLLSALNLLGAADVDRGRYRGRLICLGMDGIGKEL